MKNFFPRLIVVLVGIVGCALIAFGSGHLGFPGTCVLAAGFVYCVIVGNIWATVRAGAKYRELRPGGLGHVFAVGGAILISSGFFLGNDVEIIASFVAGVLAVWIANASLTRVQKKTFQKSDYKNKIRALRDAQKMAVITGKTKPMETPEEREESVVKAGDRIRTRWDHKFFLDVL
ncbi:MAG: hypothetical protein LBR88_09160, partial [Zoogloeaceae bacterium]|nr:hypothetical protein [Zoogloeaceae bacterium]